MKKHKYLALIKQAAVDSSWLEDVTYENDGIVVSLKNGLKYFYENVPIDVFQQLMNSSSKGVFINKEIKPTYSYKQI
jgi:pantothenate kinase